MKILTLALLGLLDSGAAFGQTYGPGPIPMPPTTIALNFLSATLGAAVTFTRASGATY